ncbi:MAG: hypothetical protein ACOYOY_04200, partial [Planktothrix agardhii]
TDEAIKINPSLDRTVSLSKQRSSGTLKFRVTVSRLFNPSLFNTRELDSKLALTTNDRRGSIFFARLLLLTPKKNKSTV